MRILMLAAVIAAAGAMLFGCAEHARSATPASGIVGVTMVDQGCPILHDPAPCPEKPLQARITVMRPGSWKVVAQAESDAEGRFRVALEPGPYVLRAQNSEGSPAPWARQLDVEGGAGVFTRVTLRYDPAIRAQPL